MATANLDTDCKLVEDSQEGRYDCPVCLQILRDPYMSLCCRNNFCHACFIKLRNAGDPCPLCRNSEFRTNRNTLLCLTVDHLQVYCAHKAKGCQWVGDFGDYEVHLNQRPVLRYQANGCPFVKVSCQYCSKSFQRGQICAHVGTCPRRPFMCEYCQSYDSFYEEVSSIHWPVCRYYPVLCPNGCNEHVARQSLRRHIAKNCSMTVIECDFKLFGCTAKLSRKDMETHVKNSVAAHDSLKLMSKFVSQLKKKLREIQELETKLHEKHKNLVQAQKVSLKREVSIAITKTGQQQIQTITGLKATFTKRNEHLVKEYGTALEKRIIGVLDDTEERVWSQVEQLASDQLESVTQIEQLKEEINEQSLELSILRHRVRHIEGLFALYYRGRRLCDAIAKAIMASVCAAITLTIIISFIAWLGFPLAFQIFIFLLLLCSPAGFIVFLR